MSQLSFLTILYEGGQAERTDQGRRRERGTFLAQSLRQGNA